MSPEQQNPYAAPRAKLVAALDAGGGVWRDGKVLVCRRDAVFPPRCVKCNDAAAAPPERVKLAWHNGLWYLLIFLNILIYLVVALAVRKRAEVEVGLCSRHRRRGRLARIIGWGGLAAIVAGVFLGLYFGLGWLAGVSMVAIAPWALASVLLSLQLRAAKIGEEELRIRGCGRDFLDTLPEHQG
jgi:hypothetical protein